MNSKGAAIKGHSGRNIAVSFLVILVAAAVVYAVRHGISFDFRSFFQQLRGVSVSHAAIALLLIYGTYLLRSFRWTIFLRSQKRMSPLSLVGTQFIGFAAVALFGRIADLSRPYLVAQKTKLPLSSQIAVYTIERMFDLGAAALIFSTALAYMPRDMAHHEIFVRVGVASLAGTLLIACFAGLVRVMGVKIASACERMLASLSPRLSLAVSTKILAFRDGLNAIRSLQEFVLVALLSLAMWLMIAYAYVHTTHAFTYEPTLAHNSFSQTMLLMGASIGSSILQLPVLGWFTQIAATAAAMHAFYGTPLETATACGGLLLLITFLFVIPVGVVFAKIDSVKLGDLRRRSETAEEQL